MKRSNIPDISNSLLQYFRCGVQLSYLVVCIYTAIMMKDDPDLPHKVFLGIIILCGMFFCGWFCPFGTVQEYLRPVGRKLGLTLYIPPQIDRYLSYLRYIPGLLLPLTIWSVLDAQGNFERIFSSGPVISAGTVFIAVMLLLALFTERPFCKYICFYGASNSLWAALRIFTIRRKKELCIGCGQCDRICPMRVRISTVENVRDISCINCLKCVAACPEDGTLKYAPTRPRFRDFADTVPWKKRNSGK